MITQFLITICVIPVLAFIKPGPEVQPTKGEIWPEPVWQYKTGRYSQLDPEKFQFVVLNENCGSLEKALSRYSDIIKKTVNNPVYTDVIPGIETITHINVNLTKPCEALPYYGMDESYYVDGHGKIVSNSIWGILRGLETLSQILVPMPNGMLRIPQTEIYDEPRFKYRGLMLDTARHFISVPKILQLIDGMSYNKLNVFHWHMTDDSAFPYNSTRFPELSAKGAYNSKMTYSTADVLEIIEHARLRGIRVIPEFDSPAHSASWGSSHPEIMTKCYGRNGVQLGPLNPTKQRTFNFLDKLYSEIRSTFPDKYVHIGGDEVDSACWESNPSIQKYLRAHGRVFRDLPYMFFEKLTSSIYRNGQLPILWQEAVEENPGIMLPYGTMVQVWYNSKFTMASLTRKGYTTILSDGYYLCVGDDGADWMHFYNVEPTNFFGDWIQKRRVAGGEACLYTEWINNNNVISMAFPRANAVAERLWSKEQYRNSYEAEPRFEEHNCRMYWRGIETRPANGIGLC